MELTLKAKQFNDTSVSEIRWLPVISWQKLAILSVMSIVMIGFLVPEDLSIPVQGATRYDWNKKTFWNNRWGRSGVHKGIDIFASRNKPVKASSPGVVLYKDNLLLGGNVVAILGPKWRIHYYAHLNKSNVSAGSIVHQNDTIGTIGNTGNAKGKPSHLHYSIFSIIPYPWRIDASNQGWKKMFFLNPAEHLRHKSS